jgi:hypothetical protein
MPSSTNVRRTSSIASYAVARIDGAPDPEAAPMGRRRLREFAVRGMHHGASAYDERHRYVYLADSAFDLVVSVSA